MLNGLKCVYNTYRPFILNVLRTSVFKTKNKLNKNFWRYVYVWQTLEKSWKPYFDGSKINNR